MPISTAARNPPQVLHAAVHEVSLAASPGSVVGALFADGAPSVINAPGNKTISITVRSNRAANRAGTNFPLGGLTRGGDRISNQAFVGVPVSSTVIRMGSEDLIYGSDRTDFGNLNPTDQAVVAAGIRKAEMESARIVRTGLMRFWERKFYSVVTGSALDYTTAPAFTSTAFAGADASLNPNALNLSNENLDVKRFIANMLDDLNISSGGMVTAYGVQLVVTPGLLKSWAGNPTLQNTLVIGDVTAGVTSIRASYLNRGDVELALMAMDNRIKGVQVMDGMQDTAAVNASESIGYILGSALHGITAMIHPDRGTALVNGSDVSMHRTAIARHHFMSEQPRWVENANHTGWKLIADQWQNFPVINAALGRTYYDA